MKFDLHRHLLGAASYRTVETLSQRSAGKNLNSLLTSPQQSFMTSSNFGRKLLEKLTGDSSLLLPSDLLNFSSLPEFLQSYIATSCLVSDEQSFRLLAEGVVEDIANEELGYSEITISPTLYLDRGISEVALVSTLKEVQQASRIPIRWLLDPIRNKGPEHALSLLEHFVTKHPGLFCGASLAGDERSSPLERFLPYFQYAKKNGLGTTCHIGEQLYSEELESALSLPLDRIGHGIAFAAAPELLERALKKDVYFEVCLSSNLRTCVVESLLGHPVVQLHTAGAKITLHTDDPFFFKTSLQNEFDLAQTLPNGKELVEAAERNASQAGFSL